MTAASPIDIAVNPNNTAQRYILWGNGRVDAVGGAPPNTAGPLWFDRLDNPVARAIHITNWTNGQGYILDFQGGFQAMNGAPTLGVGTENQDITALGVPYLPGEHYVDWSWNPDGSTQGYVLDQYGQIFGFGGATAPPRTGPRWTLPVARKFEMQWTPSKKAVTMDLHGGLHNDFGAPTVANPYSYWPTGDVARDFRITDWTASPQGYLLDWWGAIHVIGNVVDPVGTGPYLVGSDVARNFWVLSAVSPLKFWQVWSGGQQFEYTVSNPPTVTAGGIANSPATTVQTTTQPVLAWSYSDPNQDAQAGYQVLLFTQAYVDAHSMTDPLVWKTGALEYYEGTVSTVRGVTPTIDLMNGTYRFYVRVMDASGKWSAWANRGWTQNVPVPNTPTAMGAVPDTANFRMNLSVATTGIVAQFVRFDYSDDGGITWRPVRSASRVTRVPTTSAIDRDVPLGKMRGYRAVQFSESPRTASAPSASVFAQTDTSRLIYVLTSTKDSTLGGEIFVKDAPSWDREASAGVFEGDGAYFSTVVSDFMPLKARKQTISIETDNVTQWDAIWKLLETGGTLVYRDPFGVTVYCRVVGTVTPTQRKKLPYPTEVTPLRHNHLIRIPLVEVAQPV